AVEEEAAWKRRLTITVDPAHVAETRRRETRKLGGSVRLKGFRKGRVPSRVIEERFGPAIDERALTALVNEGFREAVRARGLNAIGDPRVDEVQYEPGESLTFQVEVEVMPEVRLARVGGFRIKRPQIAVSDDEIEEILERMRADHAVLEPVERSPENGDVVSVRIRPVDDTDGEGERKPYRFELGAGYAIPDVEDAIRTLAPGGSGLFDVRYPEDFGNESLAGSTRTLHIELIDVKTKRLPALDDELARQVGDFETLEELRTAVADDVRAHHEREAERAVRDRLVDSVLEANPFEVPPSLIQRYLDRVIEAPDDADPAEIESARRSLAPAVEKQIKRDLVLERLVETEGLAATEGDVEERLRTLAERRNLSPAEMRKRLAREKR
ncbi:MAG: trigger factor, partial [Gemmatimonadota bacterium]